MLQKFSNLAALCIALAAAAGMLAWASTLAINMLLDEPGDDTPAAKMVQPIGESGPK